VTSVIADGAGLPSLHPMWSRQGAAAASCTAIRVGAVCAPLLLASLCAACGTHITQVTQVRFRPDGDEWEPRDQKRTALRRSGGAEVTVDLATEQPEFPLTGAVRNRGAEPLRVAYQPEREVRGDAVIGRLLGSGEPEPLLAGAGFDLPAADAEGPSVRRFALRLDEAWPDTGVPAVGATVSYVVVFQSSAGETRIPLRFRVAWANRSPRLVLGL